MNHSENIRRSLAILLSISVLHLGSAGAFAGDMRVAAATDGRQFASGSLANILAPKQAPRTAIVSEIRSIAFSQPLAVTSSMGEVAWKSVQASFPFWNCRTGAGSSVRLDLESAGKVSILERSSLNVQAVDGELILTLLRGSIHLEGASGARIRVQTYDGIYRLDTTRFYEAWFSWRDGQLVASGDVGSKVEESNAAIVDSGLGISSEKANVPLRPRKAQSVSVVVADPAGKPLPGVPVLFSSKNQQGSRFRVSFAGAASVRVLTDENGIAETKAAVFGRQGTGVVAATVQGTSATTAVPADVPPTTGGQKIAALLIVGGITAATIALVLNAIDEDDPQLTPGAPTRR